MMNDDAKKVLTMNDARICEKICVNACLMMNDVKNDAVSMD